MLTNMWICRVFLKQSYTRFNNKCDFDIYLYSVPDKVNFNISNIISIYLGSNYVFDLIHFHTSTFKYVYFFFNNNNHNIYNHAS